MNRFDVNIAGYALTVQTERSAEHMRLLAETLNEKVREIQKTGGTANYLNIVMLAAMELADEVITTGGRIREAAKFEDEVRRLDEEVRRLRRECEEVRTERESLKDRLDRRSRELLATLENALK